MLYKVHLKKLLTWLLDRDTHVSRPSVAMQTVAQTRSSKVFILVQSAVRKKAIITVSTYCKSKPGSWHNGSALVFRLGDGPFKFEPSPTSADACWEVASYTTGCQEVGTCST